MLDWLNRAQFQSIPANRSYTPDETIRLLAERLSSQYQSKSEEGAAQSAVRNSIDDDVVQIRRLLALLKPPRFKGVWGQIDEHDLNTILPFVRDRVTRHDEHGKLDEVTQLRKERRDHRDALNLCVVFRAFRTREIIPLLVSNTKDLVELPEHYRIGQPSFEDFQTAMDGLLELSGQPVLGDHPKAAIDDHLKTGQR